MMNPAIKNSWLGRLRSGAYRQMPSTLGEHDGNGRCCLGVLCDVLGAKFEQRYSQSYPELPVSGLGVGGEPTRFGKSLREQDSEYLTQEVLDEVGLTHQQQLHLAKMNDGGFSFLQIADVIEAFT